MTSSDAPTTRGPQLWQAAAGYLALALVFAVIQPLGGLPDEPAHDQYIEFLATQRRLPLWQPNGGEAGFESQHPPLSYLLYVPAAIALGGCSQAVRMQGLRVVACLVGLLFVLVCGLVLRRVFGDTSRARYATATVGWMPLVLLYGCHANPDLIVALAAAVVLWLSWAQATSAPDPRRAAWLGVAVAAAYLTKLSGLAVVAPAAVGWCLALRRQADRRAVVRDGLLTAGVGLLLVVPWICRSLRLYGTPAVKTVAPYGCALDYVRLGRMGVGQLLGLTLRNTYFSTWTQPDWLPGWPAPGGPVAPIAPVILFYGLVTLCLLAAIYGLSKAELEPGVRDFLVLGAVLLAALVAGQQLAFWTRDIEFNMGGRYVLSAMLFIAALIATGLEPLARSERLKWLPTAWLGLLLALDLVGAATILLILNPHYRPGWKVFSLS